LDDVITSRGIRTNPISILILFSVTVAVAIVAFVAIRNKNNMKNGKKHNHTIHEDSQGRAAVAQARIIEG
jgi:hypothetical protein